jgi:hypothetical protein
MKRRGTRPQEAAVKPMPWGGALGLPFFLAGILAALAWSARPCIRSKAMLQADAGRRMPPPALTEGLLMSHLFLRVKNRRSGAYARFIDSLHSPHFKAASGFAQAFRPQLGQVNFVLLAAFFLRAPASSSSPARSW